LLDCVEDDCLAMRVVWDRMHCLALRGDA